MILRASPKLATALPDNGKSWRRLPVQSGVCELSTRLESRSM